MSEQTTPIAIIGISCRYPGATDADQLWHTLRTGPDLLQELPKDRWITPAAGETGNLKSSSLAPPRVALMAEETIDPVTYGIPPIHASALARMQLLLLDAADRCLADAGYGSRDLDREATDVICGTCFGFDRTFSNALRIEGARLFETVAQEVDRVCKKTPDRLRDGSAHSDDEPHLEPDTIARELKQGLQRRLRPSAYDRVGEMASTIPARIAVVFKLRGRAVAIDAADGTSFAALSIAARNLRSGSCNLALVACGQRIEGPLLPMALASKGLLSSDPCSVPFATQASGYQLGEGVGALLLKRLDDAQRDEDRIYAVIKGIASDHVAKAGSLRYPTSLEQRTEVIRAACRASGVSPRSIGYVECFGSAIPAEQEAELESLSVAVGDQQSPARLGCVKEIIGHTFANAGVAAVTKVALALRHRSLVPQYRLEGQLEALRQPGLSVLTDEQAWPEAEAGTPRRAGVNGATLTGSLWHIVLEEHVEAKGSQQPSSGRSRTSRPPEPIAIIGLGCSFPDAPGAETFWLNNVAGLDSLRALPQEVFDRDIFLDPRGLDLFKSYSAVGGVAHIPHAPPDLFRIPPRRWIHTDPAQRLALAAAAELVRRYGYPERPLPSGRGTCIMASSLCLGSERAANTALLRPELEALVRGHPALARLPASLIDELLERARAEAASPGDETAVRNGLGSLRRELSICQDSLDGFAAVGVAAQISNLLGLRAAPIVAEAACASSLAALDLATTALRSGEIDYAFCGGVEIPTNERDLVLCAALRLLSRDRIRPFDAKADGFSAGSGIGLFLLKRLSDARRSGDRIWATIRGIGASNDARSLVAPDVRGQALAMRRAFHGIDVDPGSVEYIETHGTGTEVGDQVESLSTALVYGRERRQQPIWMGSVKSMIGHTFAAAGAAGITRAVLALVHRTIPPTIGIGSLNRKLGLDLIPARVCTRTTRWSHSLPTPRRAAVSAFGTGGINYHVILEEAES